MAETATVVARALVTRFYEDMWNRFDTTVLEQITAAEVTFRGSIGDYTVGRTQLGDYVRKIQMAFPDFHNEVVQLVVESGSAFARLTYTGTHLGRLENLEPTGRSVAYDGAALFQVRDGVIADVWVLGDRRSLEEQLGVRLPPIGR